MPKVSVTYEFSSPQEAAAFLQASVNGFGGPGTGTGPSGQPSTGSLTTISPSNPPPPAPAVTMGNPPPPSPGGPPATPPPPAGSPPPSAPPPAAPPPAPSAPPPAPPPAPAPSAPAGGLQAEVLTAMQAWSKAGYKAAGIKRVLAKAGIASISPQTPPQTLEWLKWAFSPQNGQYMTPEYIESL